MSSRQLDRAANEAANSPRASDAPPSADQQAVYDAYRFELFARIVAIDPSYVWTGADLLASCTMCDEFVAVEDAARAFVASRNARPELKRVLAS